MEGGLITRSLLAQKNADAQIHFPIVIQTHNYIVGTEQEHGAKFAVCFRLLSYTVCNT